MFNVLCEQIGRRKAYYVKFPFNDQLIAQIKLLPEETRKWNGAEKVWELTTLGLLKLILHYKGSKAIFFDFGGEKNREKAIIEFKKISESEKEKKKLLEELEKNKKHWIEYKQYLEENYEQFSDMVHSKLKEGIKLYPHQIVGTMFLNETRSALLALDMGTGKSLVSISFSEINDFNKVFVITPNSLKFNYLNELDKFTFSKGHIIGYKKNKYSIDESKYLIVNYDYFNPSDHKKMLAKFNKLNIGKIDTLICDESHRISNSQSNTFFNFNKIFKPEIFKDGKVSKVFLSGTPAPSRISQLYTVLNQISPLEFATKKRFYEYYCGMTYNPYGYGWELNEDMTKYEELFHKINPFMYRKKKMDVLKDLPEVTIQKIILEMSPEEQSIYEKLEVGIVNEFINEKIFNPATIMLRLKQYTSHLKTKNVSDLIDSILESGEKLVIVDFFKEGLKKLHKDYPESVLHTGDFKDYERAQMVNDFQNNDNVKLFLGSEPTIKEGLTLTIASKIGIMTIPYNPGVISQIYSRLQRIGQKNAVNVYLFIYRNSIDEYILDLVERKQKDISQVIDNEKYESNIEENIIKDLVKIIKEKHKVK